MLNPTEKTTLLALIDVTYKAHMRAAKNTASEDIARGFRQEAHNLRELAIKITSLHDKVKS